MPELVAAISGQVQLVMLGFLFAGFLLVLFVGVMTRNYRRLRHETITIECEEGERLIDRIAVRWWLMATETWLTDRRVLQLRLSWFASKRKLKCISLRDVHSVIWKRYTNWILLLLGWLFVGVLNPVSLLLVLYGLQAKVYCVRFNTPFSSMPKTRIVVASWWRRQMSECDRFYRNALDPWSRARSWISLPMALNPAQPKASCETDFAWGRPVLLYVWAFILLGIVQRVVQGHVSYDDYLFAPLYLALPVAVSNRSLRDAAWATVLGFAVLLTVKFPTSLPGISSFLAGGVQSAYIGEYAFILVTMLIIVLLAWWLAVNLHPLASAAPLVLWLLFVGLHMPDAARDTGLYARVCLAMAWSVVLAYVEGRIGAHYGACPRGTVR